MINFYNNFLSCRHFSYLEGGLWVHSTADAAAQGKSTFSNIYQSTKMFKMWKIEHCILPPHTQGVTFPGLGVFTFSQKKIDVGSNKFIVIQRPVFVLSEKFVQTHSLQYPKQHTSGQCLLRSTVWKVKICANCFKFFCSLHTIMICTVHHDV